MGHKKRRANAMLYCVQRDKEPLGVWMVSSPVSREAGRQPDKNILLTLFVDSKHHLGQHTVCQPAPLRPVQSRILRDYSKADPKQTNKQEKGAVFYDVTPCCTETTLGVSKSSSLLGSKE